MGTRPLKRRDLRACAHLMVLAGVIKAEEEEAALARLTRWFDKDHFCGVVAEEGAIVAFALGNYIPHHFGNIFYLREMCTHKEWRGKGAGNMIYRALEAVLVTEKVTSIYVPERWGDMDMDFFIKRGFERSDNSGIYSRSLTA